MHFSIFISPYTDLSLFFLRVTVAMIFGSSGYHHLRAPREFEERQGLNVAFTMFLGTAELAAAIGLVVGILIRYAALGLVVLLIGTIIMKAGKWKSGFWGQESIGWHYDLMLLSMNLVIMCTGGGRYTLF